MKTNEIIEQEFKYGAHNYHPLPVVLEEGRGVYVWDVDGKRYYDCLAGYSALNQGHCHPAILEALFKQASQLTLTSRAFHSDTLAPYMAYMCQVFGYDKLLPMNTGAEAVETALKLARKWGYKHKGIKENDAIIVVCNENFHGRTISIISFSSDPQSYKGFGPYTPGFVSVPYNDSEALREVLQDPRVVGFLVEPVQGEAGVIVPDPGYLSTCYDYCQEANVLFIADEIQSGMGRTGRLLACDYDEVHPDVLILGKALSGGLFPISAVLSSDEVILSIKPGEHGSTFGGSPLSAKVAQKAVEVLIEENMVENAYRMGEMFRGELAKIHSPYIKTVRGKGLMNAIEIQPHNQIDAWEICLRLMEEGVLAKPTHEHTIRFTPPLIIDSEQMTEVILIIQKVLSSLPI
ncbi:MAG: ornithine--oxo-acid transaminase [Bacteroidales bacterium]